MGVFAARALKLRWCGLVLGVAVVALVVPVQASARKQSTAGSSKRIFLSTGTAKKVKGLKVSLFGAPKQGSTLPASAGAFLFDKVESDSYNFNKGITYSAKSDLSSAHVSGNFALGRGSIKMTFHATKPATKVPVPKGCKGTAGKKRKGVLKGSFQLKADKLGKVTVSSVRATLTIPASFTCPIRQSHGVSVSGSSSNGSISVDASRPTQGGVSESISVNSSGPGYFIYHSVFVGGLSNAHYTHAANLSTAKVTAGNPLHGAANYSGSPAVHKTSSGTLNGSMTAHFATIGTVKPFANGALQATQYKY